MGTKRFRPSVDLTGQWPRVTEFAGQNPSELRPDRPGIRHTTWKSLTQLDRELVVGFLSDRGFRVDVETQFSGRLQRIQKRLVVLAENDPVVIDEGAPWGHSVQLESKSLRHGGDIVLTVSNCDTQEEANEKVREWLEDIARVGVGRGANG